MWCIRSQRILKSKVNDLYYFVFFTVELAWSCVVLLFFLNVLVESVTLEDLLNRTLTQQDLVLLHHVAELFIFFGRRVSNIIRIIPSKSFEWRLNCSSCQIFPRKISKPCVSPQLMRPSPSQSSLGPSLYEFVHKIGSFNWPSFRNILFFNSSLFGHHLLPNGPPILSHVRPSPHHKFKHNNSQSIVIDLKTVILPHHNLRRHVARSSACICWVLFSKLLSDS